MPLLRYRRCPACHRPYDSSPVFREDESYCCLTCADGRLCACMTEADLDDDGVDGLGLPFRALHSEAREINATAVTALVTEARRHP